MDSQKEERKSKGLLLFMRATNFFALEKLTFLAMKRV